ncbi:Rv3654c family TadE-like protein [Actinokineospora sp. 24-640]
MAKPHDDPEPNGSPAPPGNPSLADSASPASSASLADSASPASSAASDGSGDEGVATVWAAVAVAALAALLAAVVGVGAAVVGRHRAAGAADLAALAGAAHAWSGVGVACARAEEVVSRMGAELRVCEVSGLEVTVRVARRVPAFGWAEVSARAGPVDGGISVGAKSQPRPAGRRGALTGRAVGRARRTAGGSGWFSSW